MGRAMRHFAITNSPVVRSFIKPVQAIVPGSTSSSSNTSKSKNPYIADDDDDGDATNHGEPSDTLQELHQPEGAFLIPTQPAVDVLRVQVAPTAGTSDVKGKKRARDDTSDAANGDTVPYDAENGTRYGVQVRYTEDNLPAELEKYWAQRYRLFSLFDEGCQMDREGWYSVTPENIAAQIAERCRSGVILDAFCGVGGNAIQFAFTCERVIALDTSPVRLGCAAHNAALYGVADRITFVLADWVTWTESYLARLKQGQVPEEEKIEVVFLSPPWGGIEYQTLGEKKDEQDGMAVAAAAGQPPPNKRARTSGATALSAAAAAAAIDTPTEETPPSLVSAKPVSYPLCALAPLHGVDLFRLAQRITPNIAYYLPRNTDLLEIAALADPAKGERVEVEEEWMSGKLKAVTAYFGELVAPAEG